MDELIPSLKAGQKLKLGPRYGFTVTHVYTSFGTDYAELKGPRGSTRLLMANVKKPGMYVLSTLSSGRSMDLSRDQIVLVK